MSVFASTIRLWTSPCNLLHLWLIQAGICSYIIITHDWSQQEFKSCVSSWQMADVAGACMDKVDSLITLLWIGLEKKVIAKPLFSQKWPRVVVTRSSYGPSIVSRCRKKSWPLTLYVLFLLLSCSNLLFFFFFFFLQTLLKRLPSAHIQAEICFQSQALNRLHQAVPWITSLRRVQHVNRKNQTRPYLHR